MSEVSPAMIETLLGARRSVRGFLPDPVPQALLERIFATAQQAPSNCNAQPWLVHVVSGEAAERMRRVLHDAVVADQAYSPDVPMTTERAGLYRERQIGSAKALFEATGVARGDTDARRQSYLRNFRFFDAPHAAFIFMPACFGLREAADCGMYAQSLMLTLTAHGLASCPQTALSYHAAVVKREFGVGPEHLLLFGIAFGYEDPNHPANTVRLERAPLAETTCFHR